MKRLALVLMLALLGATGQTNPQLMTYQDVVDNQAAGNFRWVASALTGSNQIITSSAFAAAVTNNSACPNGGSATTYQITFGDALGCRTLAAGVSQQSTSIGGTAYGVILCNTTCLAGGGSPTPAQPIIVSISVAQVDATHPVALSGTAGSAGTWNLKDNAGTVQLSASTTTTISGSATAGATGTWTFTFNAPSSTNINVTGTATSYY